MLHLLLLIIIHINMKKLFSFGVVLFAMLLFSSCSSDQQSEQVVQTEMQNSPNIDLVAEFKGGLKEPLDIQNPQFIYVDQESRRPVELGYWECANNVYTDGYNTYTYTIYNDLNNAPPNATYVWDDFSQTMYAYTTEWGGTCS